MAGSEAGLGGWSGGLHLVLISVTLKYPSCQLRLTSGIPLATTKPEQDSPRRRDKSDVKALPTVEKVQPPLESAIPFHQTPLECHDREEVAVIRISRRRVGVYWLRGSASTLFLFGKCRMLVETICCDPPKQPAAPKQSRAHSVP